MNDSPLSVPPVCLVVVNTPSSPERALLLGCLRTQRIEQFLGTRNLAANTKRNYDRQLRVFMDWVDKDWHMITLNDLKNYKVHL